jgi:hypothetical protein
MEGDSLREDSVVGEGVGREPGQRQRDTGRQIDTSYIRGVYI